MAKHGAEAHYLRPDFTYRTSVLQPTVGYNPVPDAQAVAARFVAPMGLAGTVATRHHLGAPSLASRWAGFKARVSARFQAARMVRQLRTMPAAAAPVTVDTSPRPADPSAIAVQNGLAPAPQTRASVMAPMIMSQDGPPLTTATQTAVAMTPEAAWPATYWQDVIAGGLPPIVAARGGGDALYKWFNRGRS